MLKSDEYDYLVDVFVVVAPAAARAAISRSSMHDCVSNVTQALQVVTISHGGRWFLFVDE